MDFLSANSRFEVQNDGTYLPWIMKETCNVKILKVKQNTEVLRQSALFVHLKVTPNTKITMTKSQKRFKNTNLDSKES